MFVHPCVHVIRCHWPANRKKRKFIFIEGTQEGDSFCLLRLNPARLSRLSAQSGQSSAICSTLSPHACVLQRGTAAVDAVLTVTSATITSLPLLLKNEDKEERERFAGSYFFPHCPCFQSAAVADVASPDARNLIAVVFFSGNKIERTGWRTRL